MTQKLSSPKGIDLSSNDYLCLSQDKRLKLAMIEAIKREGVCSTASRLLRGERKCFANVEITVGKTPSFIKDFQNEKFMIVEGAGGIFVPLNENELMIDLMKSLKLPILVVARSSLGTINHTLLTIESLRNRDLEIFGVIMNGEPNLENKRAIEHFGKVRVLAEMPRFEQLDDKVLKDWSENNLCRL